MILETLMALVIIQGALNNAEYIEDRFHRADRIVYAVKRTRHTIVTEYDEPTVVVERQVRAPQAVTRGSTTTVYYR